jgi:hypothetical protein
MNLTQRVQAPFSTTFIKMEQWIYCYDDFTTFRKDGTICSELTIGTIDTECIVNLSYSELTHYRLTECIYWTHSLFTDVLAAYVEE